MIPILLLLLAAWSEPSPQDTAPPGRIQETALPPSSAAPVRDTNRPGEIRTFRDWIVGCDNVADCTATALQAEGQFESQLALTVERKAGPFGTLRLRISGPADPVAPVTITVDGRRIAQGGVAWDGGVVLGGPDTLRMTAAIANGRRATISSGGIDTDVSLAGAAAALRWMDEQQGRAGTETAILARGPGAATIVPSPATPVIAIPALSGTPLAIPTELLDAMREQGQCETFADDPGYGAPEVHALTATLSVVALPCSRGAYNAMSALFLVDGDGARPAPVDAPTTMSPEEGAMPTVTNASYDRGVFTSFAKGRGVGDCGIAQELAWDGTRFRRIHQSEMPECRGSLELIPTFRAQVQRQGE